MTQREVLRLSGLSLLHLGLPGLSGRVAATVPLQIREAHLAVPTEEGATDRDLELGTRRTSPGTVGSVPRLRWR
jgi:hypothetical protein